MTTEPMTLSTVIRLAAAEAKRLAASGNLVRDRSPATLEAIHLLWGQIQKQAPWNDTAMDALGHLVAQITGRASDHAEGGDVR